VENARRNFKGPLSIFDVKVSRPSDD